MMRLTVVVGMLLAAMLAGPADAAVICKKKSGALVVRDPSCKKKETQLTLSDFGAVGPQGPAGPSNAYTTGFASYTDLPEAGTPVQLMTLDVPDGSYLVTVRLQGITVTDPDGAPGNNYRYDCALGTAGTTIEDWVARVGYDPDHESYLVYTGGFSGSGPITFTCSAGNGHPLQAQSGSMTALKVGALN